jgi:hypothetical protein
MLHKLPTSRTDKNSVHASIPSGVYRLDAFSTTVQGSRRQTEVVIRLARCGAEPPETFAAPYIPNAAMEAGTTSKARSPFVQLLYEIVLGRSRR